MIVAIDGLSGAGKTSVAKSLAKEMGCVCVRTGILFRMVTLNAHELKIEADEDERVGDMLKMLFITIREDENGKFEYFSNGYPVLTKQLFCEEVNKSVKDFAKNPKVIKFVERTAQGIAQNFSKCVVEGRNVCSNVIPDADVKFFLTASIEERARRRFHQFAKNGHNFTQEEVLAQTCEADLIDKHNKRIMLSKQDVVALDTTTMSKDDVLKKIQHGIERKSRENCFFRQDKQYQMQKFINEFFVQNNTSKFLDQSTKPTSESSFCRK